VEFSVVSFVFVFRWSRVLSDLGNPVPFLIKRVSGEAHFVMALTFEHVTYRQFDSPTVKGGRSL
jgi:hypothetical protein